MRVSDMHLVSIAVLELEQDAPRPIDVDRPEFAQLPLEFVQADMEPLNKSHSTRSRIDL